MIEIRAYTPNDREAVRTIACDTADRGHPVARLFTDRGVVADMLTRYYTDYESQAVWVAESDGRVVGYLTGCLNTGRYWRMMVWCVGPAALWRAIGGGALWSPQTWRVLGSLVHTWLRGGLDRHVPFNRYPAHLHVNLQQGFRGQGVGQRLVERFLTQAKTSGACGVHLSIRGDNGPARTMFERLGFTILSQHPIVPPQDEFGDIRETVIYGKTL